MITTIDIEAVNIIDLSVLKKYINWSSHEKYFTLNAGTEHYKLLAYIANSLEQKTIINIGTCDGLEAAALSINKNNKVITYDYCDLVPLIGSIRDIDNIEIHVEDFMDSIQIMLDSSMIVINLHPHDSYEEKNILNMLFEKNYDGLIVLTNINVTPGMRKLWANITQNKYDVTRYGFWGGTGLICSNKIILN